MAQIVELNAADFDTVTSSGKVFVDFYATWCNPCKMFGKVLEQTAKEYDGSAVIAKVNVDEAPELAVKFNINTIPHVVVFSDGNVVYSNPGAMTKPEILEHLK
jgi:thioredoxin 1